MQVTFLKSIYTELLVSGSTLVIICQKYADSDHERPFSRDRSSQRCSERRGFPLRALHAFGPRGCYCCQRLVDARIHCPQRASRPLFILFRSITPVLAVMG